MDSALIIAVLLLICVLLLIVCGLLIFVAVVAVVEIKLGCAERKERSG